MRRSPAGPWRTCRSRWCSRSSSARWSRFADAFLPAAAFLEKEGHVTNWEGRGQRIHRVRDPRGMSPARLGDLRQPRAGVRRRPGVRDAGRAPRGDGRAPGAAATRRVSPWPMPALRRRRRGRRALLFTYPLLVDEGRLSERADELKAALADPPFVGDPPGGRGRGRRRRRGRRASARPRPGRPRCRRASRSTSRKARSSCRSTRPGSPRTRFSRVASRSRPRSSRRHAG